MPSALHARLSDLAASFADSVLAAIRSASLDELRSGGEVGNGRPRLQRREPVWAGQQLPPLRRRAARGGGDGTGNGVSKPGRLPRRSAEDIAKALDRVVAAVKKQKDGMRAEDIKKALGLDVREVPRVLKEGIAKKKLRAKGQKRATTYFAR